MDYLLIVVVMVQITKFPAQQVRVDGDKVRGRVNFNGIRIVEGTKIRRQEM